MKSVGSYRALPALGLGVAGQRGQRDTAVTWAGGLGRGTTQFLRLLQTPTQKLGPSTSLDSLQIPNFPTISEQALKLMQENP